MTRATSIHVLGLVSPIISATSALHRDFTTHGSETRFRRRCCCACRMQKRRDPPARSYWSRVQDHRPLHDLAVKKKFRPIDEWSPATILWFLGLDCLLICRASKFWTLYTVSYIRQSMLQAELTKEYYRISRSEFDVCVVWMCFGELGRLLIDLLISV